MVEKEHIERIFQIASFMRQSEIEGYIVDEIVSFTLKNSETYKLMELWYLEKDIIERSSILQAIKEHLGIDFGTKNEVLEKILSHIKQRELSSHDIENKTGLSLEEVTQILNRDINKFQKKRLIKIYHYLIQKRNFYRHQRK